MNNTISLVSGEVVYPDMNSSMEEEKYAKFKVHLWLYMLNDNQRPTKWNKPNKKGTKVHFNYIKTQSEYDVGVGELKAYVDLVNKLFGLEIEIHGDK